MTNAEEQVRIILGSVEDTRRRKEQSDRALLRAAATAGLGVLGAKFLFSRRGS